MGRSLLRSAFLLAFLFPMAGKAATDAPLTWLKPPATPEELKMYEALKADPDRIPDFIKMRMIFRILGYPTAKEHEATLRKDGAIQALKLPEIGVSDMDYVFNKDEQILRYKLDITGSRGSTMDLAALAKVNLSPADIGPLKGDEVHQWEQVLSDPGKVGGKYVTWTVCVMDDQILILGKSPLVLSVWSCLCEKGAEGKEECLTEYPVHLEVMVPPALLEKAYLPGEDVAGIPRVDPRELGMIKGKVIHITGGRVKKDLFRFGKWPASPQVEVSNYELVN